MIAGPLIALFGTAWFPQITALLVSIFVISASLTGAVSLGWTATTLGAIGVSIGVLILGVLAGVLVRKNIWAMIGLLGLIAGFFFGAFLFTIIASASGWEAEWGYWLVTGVCAMIGTLIAC